MIVDRYKPVDMSAVFAGLHLQLEPELVQLDQLLDDDVLFQAVKADLARRAPGSLTRGRHSTPVEVTVRMLVAMRLFKWSYEQTVMFVSDSVSLRQFCRLYQQAGPHPTTLMRWAWLIGPRTLERLNDRAVMLACSRKVTRGRKLRIDGTVVQTNIHYPSDSSLLSDGVRVTSRLLRRAKALIGDAAPVSRGLFRNRSRSARKLARQIGDAGRRAGEAAKVTRRRSYIRLMEVAQASLRQARQVQQALVAAPGAVARKLVTQIQAIVQPLEQVVRQTRRRVVDGEAVPAQEKLASIFEPHTAIIRRGKAGKETEFGRRVWLDEVEGGIVSGYRVLTGSPPEQHQPALALEHHQKLFGRLPELFTADRGVYSPDNERLAQEMGVRRVALPKPGAKTPERQRFEKQRWFRRAQRFRAGVEGRISVLCRGGSLARCRAKGAEGFERWVGWGILTANLRTIARAMASR